MGNILLESLKKLAFPPLEPKNQASVQQSKGLNTLHTGFIGALKKLVKVYGATRAIAAGADEKNPKVVTLQAQLDSWDGILMEESTLNVIKAIAPKMSQL